LSSVIACSRAWNNIVAWNPSGPSDVAAVAWIRSLKNISVVKIFRWEKSANIYLGALGKPSL